MFNSKTILYATVAWLGLSAFAHAETLQEALSLAYETNPELAAGRAQLRAVDEGEAIAASGYRPAASGSGTYEKSVIDTNTFSSNSTNKTVSANIRQPLFRGFRTSNNVKSAEKQIEAGRQQLRQIEITVLRNTVSAYMGVIRDQAVVKLNQNQVDVLQRQLQASKDRFDVGELTRTDVAQSEARLSTALSNRISAEGNLTASREAYRRVVGQAPGTLEPPPPLPPLPTSVDQAIEIALKNSPTVLAASFTEEAARYEVSAAKGAVLPSADVNASISRTFSSNGGSSLGGAFNGDRTSKNVGVTLTIPLYQSGSEYATVRRAQQVRSQRMLEIAGAERETIENVRNAWEQLRTARATITASEQAVKANEIALEGVKQEQQVGSRTILDVLDAEQELLDTRVNLVRAQTNEYIAAFGLLASTGQLGARELALPVDIYDPDVHYKSSRRRAFGWDGDEKPVQ